MNQDSDLPMPQNPSSTPVDLPELGVTSEVASAWQQPLDALVSRRPAAGDVWRLEFDGATALVLVLDRDESDLLVAVVGDDSSYADTTTLLVNDDESPVGYAVGVWTSVTTRVPDFVADRHLGTLDDELFALASSLYGWVTYGRDTDVLAERRGRAVGGGADPIVDYRVALREELDRVVAPAVELVGRAEDRDEDVAPEVSLPTMLKDAQLPLSRLATALEWPRERAVRAYNGVIFVSDREVARLAELVGVSPDEVLSAVPPAPAGLVLAAHQPQARASLRRLAEQLQLPESSARREAVEATASQRLRAAGARVDWSQALNDYFRNVLDR